MSEIVQSGQTPEVEALKVPTTPETPVQKAPDDLSAKFAALAKKERMARQSLQRVKQLEQQLAERERQLADRDKSWDSEFKQTPLEALKRRGLTYEDLTKAALNDGKFQPETEVKEVRSELERFRQEMSEKEKKQLEAQQAFAQKQEQEAIETFRANIASHVDANKDKYELTALYDAAGLVFDTVEEHYLRTAKEGKPKILSVDEACGLVESYIESEIDRTASSSKKFQAKYQSLKLKEAAIENKSQSRTSTTLTNDLVPSSAMPSLLPVKTENERLARAMAALDGRKN